MFLFRILGILATRYTGTTIAQLGQAIHDRNRPTADTRTEFIGRQPSRMKWDFTSSFVHPNVCSTQDASVRPGRQTGRIKHRPGLAAILDEGKRWGISLVCPSRLGRSAFFRQTTQNLGLFRGFARNLIMNRSYCIRAVDQSGEIRPPDRARSGVVEKPRLTSCPGSQHHAELHPRP